MSTVKAFRTLGQAILLYMSLSSIAIAAMTLEVYDTYNAAPKVAEAISPLLKPNETIKTFGNKLIVRASDDTHDKILYVLKEIDRAPANFLISVRSTDQYQARKKYSASTIDIVNDNTTIRIDNQRHKNNDDAVIVYKGSSSDGKISLSLDHKRNISTGRHNLLQQVRVMEGQQALIQTGDDIPVVQLVWANGTMLATTQIDRAVTGFFVTPNMSKGAINLDISFQQQNRTQPGASNKQNTQVSTQLRIPLDEWAPLAGLSQHSNNTNTGIAYQTRNKTNNRRGIEVKVEQIR